MGNAPAQGGKGDQGVAYYRKALQADPNLSEAHLNLGHALSEEGRKEEAAKHMQQALLLKPDSPNARRRSDAVLFKLLKSFSNAKAVYCRNLWAKWAIGTGPPAVTQGREFWSMATMHPATHKRRVVSHESRTAG